MKALLQTLIVVTVLVMLFAGATVSWRESAAVAMAAAQTPVLRKGVSVQMPVTTSASPMPDADQADSLVVAVTFRGALFLEATAMTPAQLSERVKAALRRPGKRVYFKADARTPYAIVAKVLDALRTAGINAPILLTNQHDAADSSYVPPKGLEVRLNPSASDAAHTITLSQASDRELQQHAQRDRPIVLQANGKTPFGDIVHAIDVCHVAGAGVFLALPAN